MENLGSPVWIGQYRLTSRIATGGMAEVYVGRHIDAQGNFGPMVAVKKLLPHLQKDASVVRMFLNEARITAKISHPNVVRIFELGQYEGEPFIAMELLEGRTFADLRARAAEDGKRVPLPVAVRVLCEAARGLGAAHSAKDDQGQPLALVHRDFTPDNIHVGVGGDIKVIDFGIAKTATWTAGTEPGTLKGKFFYMSPEMVLSMPVDHRADIFAAGVMLYEQMCGRRPFTGTSIDEVVRKIAEGPLAPPSHFDPSLPRTLESVCLRALQRDPNARFQSMEEFVHAMETSADQGLAATSEDVGAYVNGLFPQDDHRRETLRRAREADPSIPGFPMHRTEVAQQAPPLDEAVGQQPGLAEAPVIPADAPTRAEHPRATPKKRSRSPALAVGAGVLLIGLTIAAALVFRTGSRSAKILLAQAELAPTPEAQGKLVLELAQSADVTDEYFSRASELIQKSKQWDTADQLADAWLQRSPKNFESHLLKARTSMHLRRGKRVEGEVAEMSALDPKDVRGLVVLAELRELQGDSSGALEVWSRAAEKKPNDLLLMTRKGYWLSQTGQLDEAAEVLAQLLKKQFSAEAAAELGFVKFRKEQPDEALRLLARAVRERPELMTAHYYRAAVLYQKGDAAQARAEYREADKLAGDDSRPLVALCELEVQQKSAAELESVKQRIRERFPKDADRLLTACAP